MWTACICARAFLARTWPSCTATASRSSESCSHEYIRDFEVCSVGFRPTGRRCVYCKGMLRDHCLDWDDALPYDELELSEQHASRADLVLCLGTSLVITP